MMLRLLLAAALLWAAPVRAAEPVTIGVSSRSFNPGFANMWIGIPLGLYGPTLTPEAVGTQGAAENLQLMLGGRLTMSTGVQDVVLEAMAEGRNLPAVAPCVYLRGMIFRIGVPPDSPIKDYAGLKGKKVGVASLAAGVSRFLRFAAENAGIDPNSIEAIAVGEGQQAAVALSSGRIDALATYDVDYLRIETAGVKMRQLPQPDAIKDAAVGYVFAFRKPWYDQNKDAVVAMLQGMVKAIIVMLENPEATVRVSYQMYPEAIPTGVPLEKAIADAVASIKVRAPAIERNIGASHTWCEFPAKAWEQYVDMIGLKGKADAHKFYTGELIERINAFDEPALRAWARGLKVPEGAAEFKAWAAALKPPA